MTEREHGAPEEGTSGPEPTEPAEDSATGKPLPEEAATPAGAVPAPGPRVPPGRPRNVRTGAQPAPTPSEIAVRIDDRISVIFVVGTVATFVAILSYGLLFGSAGLFTPLPTPTPEPSVIASPSPTASPSVATTASPSASPSAPPSASPSAGPSVVASPSPSADASPVPSAS